MLLYLATPTRNGVTGVPLACRDALLRDWGCRLIELKGCSDLALARNILLTTACRESADVVLLVDDDIVYNSHQAWELARKAQKSSTLVSGLYILENRNFAASPRGKNRWRTGLGFAAVSVESLLSLNLPLVNSSRGEIYPFCQFRVNGNRRWTSEDYWLCELFGGAELAEDVIVGHVKNSETLRPLPTEVSEFRKLWKRFQEE